MEWTILLFAGLIAGAVAVLTGVRGLLTGSVRVSAFSKTAMTGRAARWVCLAFLLAGAALIVVTASLMERYG
jgi:hypothetical protein